MRNLEASTGNSENIRWDKVALLFQKGIRDGCKFPLSEYMSD